MGGGALGESIKNVEFVRKIFFLIMMSEVVKTCKKSYLLMHIKAKVKHQEKKRTGCVILLFVKSTFRT